MPANLDTGITGYTLLRFKDHLAVFIAKCGCGTGRHTIHTIYAKISCLRIVTVFTVKIAALQKYGCSVAWSVHTAERYYLVDIGTVH